MTKPRERVIAALNHERADRCPMQVSFTPEFADRLRAELALRGGKQHNPHGAGNTYALERAIGEDILLTSVGWANSFYSQHGEYTDEWGINWREHAYTTPFGEGHYTEFAGHPLADAAALEAYRPPDPGRASLYEDARRVVQQYKDEYWIVGVTVTTMWETAVALRGMNQLLVDMVVDRDLAERIIDIPTRYHLAAATKLVELGVDMIWIGDDVGTQRGMLFSPELWRAVLRPRVANFIATLKGVNPRLKIAYHSDGDIGPIIPDLIDIGLDVLNPIQPACMDPADLKRRYGKNLCFWGTIDEQHTLPFGTPEDVRAQVLDRLATVGKGGGLILGPTHHVQLDTPMENFWAMVNAITEERS